MLNKNLIFQNHTFVLDSGLSFKNKRKLQNAIIQCGGTISYILNKAVSFEFVALRKNVTNIMFLVSAVNFNDRIFYSQALNHRKLYFT